MRLHLSWRPLQRPASTLAAAQGGQEEAAAEGGTPAGEQPLQAAPTFIRLLSRRVDLEAEPAVGGDDTAAAAAEAAEEGRAAQRRRKEQSADAVEAGLPLELLLDPLPLHLHAYGHGGEWKAPGNLPHQHLVMFCVLHLPLILDAFSTEVSSAAPSPRSPATFMHGLQLHRCCLAWPAVRLLVRTPLPHTSCSNIGYGIQPSAACTPLQPSHLLCSLHGCCAEHAGRPGMAGHPA